MSPEPLTVAKTSSASADPLPARSRPDPATVSGALAVPGLLQDDQSWRTSLPGSPLVGAERKPVLDPIAALRRHRGSGETRPDTADPLGGTAIPRTVLSALRSHQGGGQPLPDDLNAAAGHALGLDLSAVRVHTDPVADELTRSVQAVAFTHGADIYFSSGSFRPANPVGARLIAHELGHVGQAPGAGNVIGRAGDPTEAAADRAATNVIAALRRHATGTLDSADDRHRDRITSSGGPAVSGLTGEHHRAPEVPPVGQPQATLRREPVKGQDGWFTDDRFNMVKMHALSREQPAYLIVGPDPFAGTFGTFVFWEQDMRKYYYASLDLDNNWSAIYEREFDMSRAGQAQEIVAANKTRYFVGAEGTGVSNVAAVTTLFTSGLQSCIGWLLYSDNAAYMTHILVGDPTRVAAKGIRQQVDALRRQFVAESGSEPSSLVLAFDETRPEYAEGTKGIRQSDLAWLVELQPTAGPLPIICRVPGAITRHVRPPVEAKPSTPPRVWLGQSITLTYRTDSIDDRQSVPPASLLPPSHLL